MRIAGQTTSPPIAGHPAISHTPTPAPRVTTHTTCPARNPSLRPPFFGAEAFVGAVRPLVLVLLLVRQLASLLSLRSVGSLPVASLVLASLLLALLLLISVAPQLPSPTTSLHTPCSPVPCSSSALAREVSVLPSEPLPPATAPSAWPSLSWPRSPAARVRVSRPSSSRASSLCLVDKPCLVMRVGSDGVMGGG